MCPQHHAVKTVIGNRDEDLHTAIHEILHLMGWSSALFPYFRDQNGSPRTPRCPAWEGANPVTPLPVGVYPYDANKKNWGADEYCCATNTVGSPPFKCGSDTWEYQVSANTVLQANAISGISRRPSAPLSRPQTWFVCIYFGCLAA